MRGLVQDLRHAFRGFVKTPGFTAVAVIALALGIGANSAIFSVVRAVLLRPLPFPEPDRLVMIWENHLQSGWHRGLVSPANFLDWKDQSQSFEAMAAYSPRGFNLTVGNETERIRGAVLSGEFFRVLRADPILGRGFLPGDGRGGDRLALLSHGLWQRRFGSDPRVVGRPITLNSEAYTVIGITPPGFRLAEPVEIWALAKNVVPENPFLPPGVDITKVRGLHFFRVVARLKPGVPDAQAQAEMDAIALRLQSQYPDNNAGQGVEIVSLHESMVGDLRPALLVFLGAVGMVLLIACANVANLLLARAAARQREVAIRTALGAGRLRLIRQFLTESVSLALLGGGAGLLVALWGLDLLVALGPETLLGAGTIQIDGQVLGFTLALSILTGILFGLAPALKSSEAGLRGSLQEGGRGATTGPRARLTRNLLVVTEVALALVLLVGAGLLIKSFARLQRVDLGLDPSGVLTLFSAVPEVRYAEPPQRAEFYRQALERVASLPGVQVAGATTSLPLDGKGSELTFVIEGRPVPPPGQEPDSGYHQVSPDFFRALGIPLLQGRFFTEGDARGATGVAIINDTMARRHWPGEDPLGRRISFGTNERNEPEWLSIVGVVGDVRYEGLHAEVTPDVYVSYLQAPSRAMTLVVRAVIDPASLASAVRREVQSIDPEVPLHHVRTMREVLSDSIATRRFNMILLASFAAVAALLAAVGLYGVMAYSVTQRTHEIGVRMALGARRRDVLRMVVGQGMALALIGVVLGLGIALATTRVLRNLLFGVTVTDAGTFAGVALLLASVALLACYVPARRATKVEPMIALRYE
jgi:putative ABC transport system permease protein